MPHNNKYEVDNDLENVYAKPQWKFWSFEDFKKYTLPKI